MLGQAQKQMKADNDSLFQREMKLWQEKKDLSKERKTFEETMLVGRREMQKGKEAGGVGEEEESREKRFSRINSFSMCSKASPNINWFKFCFGAAFLFFFFLASFFLLMILLNHLSDLNPNGCGGE